MPTTIPLFPLHTVLFPGGRLKLQIFEPRYVDMVGRCMREGSGFGVALILVGVEAGGPARTANIGTLARIVDFERLDNGLLGITTAGAERFNIDLVRIQEDGLHIAEVEWLPEEAAASIDPEHRVLAELVRLAFPQLKGLYGDMEPHYDDASWVGMRLAEMLPLPPHQKQRCLEALTAQERLRLLAECVKIDRA